MWRHHKKKVDGYGGGEWDYGLMDESRPEEWGDNCAESFTGPNWFQAARGKRISWRNIPSPVSETEYDLFALSDDEPEPEPETLPTAHKHRPARPLPTHRAVYHDRGAGAAAVYTPMPIPQPNPTSWTLKEEWIDV